MPLFGVIRTAGIILVLSICLMTSFFASSAKAQDFPTTEKSIFILDTSGSNDAKQLWAGLRGSIYKKLPQAMGIPKVRGINNPKAPFDLTVTAINADSENAPLFNIVEVSDAKKMWGLIYDNIGKGPTPRRLEKIMKDFFGPTGVYEVLSQKYLSKDASASMNAVICAKDVTAQWMSNRQFMAKYEKSGRDSAAITVCEIVLKISKKLKESDQFFSNENCPQKAKCSDVIGALHRVAALAAETYEKDPSSRLCIAIASDMVSNSGGISGTTSLDTSAVVKSSVSTAEALQKGKEAAILADVKFPPKMKIKIPIIGQGSGGIAADKQQMLSAYWNGFWSAAGVSSGKKVAALTEACAS